MRIVDEGSFTDAGGREDNADAMLVLPAIPMFVVADGMGAEGAGVAAASIAVDQVLRDAADLQVLCESVAEDRTTESRLRLVQTFDALFNGVGRQVQRAAGERAAVGMGTTMLLTAIVGHTAYIAHVGDSRAYLLRQGRLIRLTEDHSVAEFRYRRGRMTREEYLTSPERQVLYQAVGTGPEVDVDLAEVRLADGDVLLLCTDGLIRAIEEGVVQGALSSRELNASMHSLLATARDAAPPDNLTAIAFRLGADEGDPGIEEVTRAMAGCFLFQALTEPERLVVAPYVEEVVWQRGDKVTQPETSSDHLGIVVSGRIREEARIGEGRDLGPGDWFGASALAGTGVWKRARTALEATRVLWFSRERFRELVRYKPDLGARMAVALAEQLRARVREQDARLERVIRALS